jgi:hypothetical protein
LLDQFRVLIRVLIHIVDHAEEGLKLLFRQVVQFVERGFQFLALFRGKTLKGVSTRVGQTRQILRLERGLFQRLCEIRIAKKLCALHRLSL